MIDISHLTVALITIIASLGLALSAAEELVMRSVYADGGLLSWTVLRVNRRHTGSPLDRVRDRLFRPRGFAALLAAKLCAAIVLSVIVLTLPDARLLTGVLTAFVLVLLLLVKARTSYGLDGADHMYIVVFLGLAVFGLMPAGSLASLAGILYIAAQSGISYLIAGLAKLRGSSWRDGTAIGGILTTRIYGFPAAAALLQGRPLLGRLMCWSVIGFELTFIAALVVDPRLMWGMLAVGLLFHASTAVLMGLNSFFFAFASTYPAVVVANELVHRVIA